MLRFGFGHIFNEHYEYFQAFDLGEDNYLRGFRKNRFAGRSLLYESTELRFKLFESKSYIVPGAVGLLAFNDVGKVWMQRVKLLTSGMILMAEDCIIHLIILPLFLPLLLFQMKEIFLIFLLAQNLI